MSLHESARWIVTYDITDRRRGGRVFRLLKGRGVPLQYSVFVVEATPAEMQRLMAQLKELIVLQADDVRAYRWPAQPECHLLGRGLLPDGVLLGADPVAAAS